MKTPTSTAFTLIELLVVITIIAILAGVSLPVYQTVILSGQQATALQNARQIGLGLRVYAGDFNGQYPAGKDSFGEPIESANDAFRVLVPSYLDNELVFAVARSKAGPRADNRMEPRSEILKGGENHFAYIAGLNSSSNSLWPVIVDGTDGSGRYTAVETEQGGAWKGTKAIVVNTDGSSHLKPLQGEKTSRYIPRFDDPTEDLLELSYMGTGAKLLEPVAN